MGKWVCGKCEAENDESARVCIVCGAKRDFTQGAMRQNTLQGNAGGAFPTGATSTKFGGAATSGTVSGDELRALIKKYDAQKSLFRVLIVLFVIVQYAMFPLRYSGVSSGYYSILRNCIGDNGASATEQICSIVLVAIAFLPAILCWIDFKVRRRSLPVTVSVFVTVLTTIYSVVIWFSDKPNFVPGVIIAASLLTMLFSILLVKALNKMDNAMYRRKGF